MDVVESAQTIRLRCRTGRLTSPTPGLAPGYIQANLIVLPSSVAADFHDLCRRNPVPCPLLGTSKHPGDPSSFTPSNLCEHEVDVRTDLPQYQIYHEGKLVGTKTDLLEDWTHDHVAFLIGCSFSFEAALVRAGLPPRHLEQKCNVPMYKTKLKLNPAGVFDRGTQVVSMRPYRPDEIDEVRNITRPFIRTHGEPIAWGWEACSDLGIRDIGEPDFGDAVDITEGEVPVFWGCGVTPQAAIMAAGDRVKGTVMGHRPGHMLVLDMREQNLV